MTTITIKKDWKWYLAEIKWYNNLFAFWFSKEEAKNELLNVIDMMMDYHLELIEKERKLKNSILKNKYLEYAL